MKRSWMAGLLDIVLNATPGAAVAMMLGWGPVGAIAMAGVTYISSSGIIAKVLGDLAKVRDAGRDRRLRRGSGPTGTETPASRGRGECPAS